MLDTNILVSALLSRSSSPAELLAQWQAGKFELVASPQLILELERVLSYPKIAQRLDSNNTAAFLRMLNREATFAPDPAPASEPLSADPVDDYLIALARQAKAYIVSGDRPLLQLAPGLPVVTAAEMLHIIAEQ